ncbi:hypothetical protein RI367_004272 [Sorochytrium milnesiophthora]
MSVAASIRAAASYLPGASSAMLSVARASSDSAASAAAESLASSTAAATAAAAATPTTLGLPPAVPSTPLASMASASPTLFSLFSSPSFCFLLFQGIIVGRIRDVAAPRRHRRLSWLTHICLRMPVIFLLLINAGYIVRLLTDPQFKGKPQQDVLYNCFRLFCLAVDIDVFLECMERGNHQFDQPLNLIEWCLTFHFTPRGKDILVVTLIQIADIILLQLMGMVGWDRKYKLIPTTVTGLIGLAHFLLRWNSPDYPTLVALAKWPELFCLFISALVCLLYLVSYIATGGKLRQRPGSLSKATFPKLTEPYSLAVFKMGGACLDVAQTAPFRNEDEPIIITPESEAAMLQPPASGYGLKYLTPQPENTSRTQRLVNSIPFLRLHHLGKYIFGRIFRRRLRRPLHPADATSSTLRPTLLRTPGGVAAWELASESDDSDQEFVLSEDDICDDDIDSETESVLGSPSSARDGRPAHGDESDNDTDVLSDNDVGDESEIYKELYYLTRDLQEPAMSSDRSVSVPPILSTPARPQRTRTNSLSGRPLTRSVAPIPPLLYHSAAGIPPFSPLHDLVVDEDPLTQDTLLLGDDGHDDERDVLPAAGNDLAPTVHDSIRLRNRILSRVSPSSSSSPSPSSAIFGRGEHRAGAGSCTAANSASGSPTSTRPSLFSGMAAGATGATTAAEMVDEDDMHIAQGFRPCVVCHSNSRNIVLKPCCCLVICDDCREELALRRYHNCPTCRRKVESYSKIYEP